MPTRPVPNSWNVYLRSLPARDIGWRLAHDDARHILDINDNISLYVHPDDDDAPAVVAGLRKLAETAAEMAAALETYQARKLAERSLAAEVGMLED